MKKNIVKTTVNTNKTNYSYSAYKSGNQTIMVWDNLAQMMMGNGLPAQGVRIIRDKEDKKKK